MGAEGPDATLVGTALTPVGLVNAVPLYGTDDTCEGGCCSPPALYP